MLNENSTLASIAFVLGKTLSNDYRLDPEPIFAVGSIDCWRSFQPGERVPVRDLERVWAKATEVTGDPLIGIRAGMNVQPGHFHAFGHSWLASGSLREAMQRLCRYHLIISTAASKIEVQQQNDSYRVVETYPKASSIGRQEAGDFGLASVLHLTNIASGRSLRPVLIEILLDDRSLLPVYEEALGTRVSIASDCTSITYTRSDFEAPFSTAIPEVAKATDRIADRYLESLDTSKIAAQVRRLLIDYLPSGDAHQDKVARSLNRSASTLQRQLQAEGTNYREVLEDTRASLAKDYLADSRFSHAQIAYLLGFSDQSNFSRAFKRWTGTGPRDFQDSIAPD